MTSVLFVHGTGGRERAYLATFEYMEQELKKLRPNARLVRCLWGDPLGAKLNAAGASIPTYNDSQGGGADVSPEEAEVQLWKALYENPLYEIRVLALRSLQSQRTPPGKLSPAQELQRRIKSLSQAEDLRHQLTEIGIASFIDQACIVVTSDNPRLFEDYLKTVSEPLDSDYEAVARAIVATCHKLCIEKGVYIPFLVSGTLRDKAFDVIVHQLTKGEESKGVISDWVKKQIMGLAGDLGTDAFKRKRGSIMDGVYPCAGDILVYQAKGKSIRDFILNQIEQIEPPVVLLAHSLGGIACVDLLVENDLQGKVHYLVTAGSQAPFFYEIGALQTLNYGKPLPEYFPEWLNIYDLRDFLSYVGDYDGLFKGRVKDIRVDNRQPFPEAHSAYWANEATWKAIDEILP